MPSIYKEIRKEISPLTQEGKRALYAVAVGAVATFGVQAPATELVPFLDTVFLATSVASGLYATLYVAPMASPKFAKFAEPSRNLINGTFSRAVKFEQNTQRRAMSIGRAIFAAI